MNILIKYFNMFVFFVFSLFSRAKSTLVKNNGEGYIDTGVKITIAVVIGALLLAGLYTLFKGDGAIMGRLKEGIEALFDNPGGEG